MNENLVPPPGQLLGLVLEDHLAATDTRRVEVAEEADAQGNWGYGPRLSRAPHRLTQSGRLSLMSAVVAPSASTFRSEPLSGENVLPVTTSWSTNGGGTE